MKNESYYLASKKENKSKDKKVRGFFLSRKPSNQHHVDDILERARLNAVFAIKHLNDITKQHDKKNKKKKKNKKNKNRCPHGVCNSPMPDLQSYIVECDNC